MAANDRKRAMRNGQYWVFKSTIASRKSETIFVIFTLPRFVYIPLLLINVISIFSYL